MTKMNIRNIVLFWLAWVIIILGFQWIVTTRLSIERPNLAVSWTSSETLRFSKGVAKVTVNGKQVEGSLIRADAGAKEINVEVVMG